MILGFSTAFPKGKGKLSGRLTYFPERIWKGILLYNLLKNPFDEVMEYKGNDRYQIDGEYLGRAKLHTMRSGKRWRKGMKIHFNIFVRTTNMFRFAPVLEVKSTQDVVITYSGFGLVTITIDGKGLNNKEKIDYSDESNRYNNMSIQEFTKIIS